MIHSEPWNQIWFDITVIRMTEYELNFQITVFSIDYANNPCRLLREFINQSIAESRVWRN